MGLTFMLGAIRRTSGNLVLCILFHSFINSFMAVFLPDQGMLVLLVAMLEVMAGILVVRHHEKGVVINAPSF